MKITDISEAFVAKSRNHPDNQAGTLPDEAIRDVVMSEGAHYAVVKFQAEDGNGRKMFPGSIDLVVKQNARLQIEIRWPAAGTATPLSTCISVDSTSGNVEVVKQDKS